jgi:hypothetical protein
MAKVHYKINPDDLAIALENGIPQATYYRRIQKGMSPEQARTQKPKRVANFKRTPTGEICEGGLGKSRQFRLSEEIDAIADQLIEKSGLTAVEYFRQLVEPQIKAKQEVLS